jgi:hypothetical protein
MFTELLEKFKATYNVNNREAGILLGIAESSRKEYHKSAPTRIIYSLEAHLSLPVATRNMLKERRLKPCQN